MARTQEKSGAEAAAWRGLAITLLIALPAAILIFLYSGDFFDSYEGRAVAHRPIPGSSGVNDTMRLFVLEREDGSWSEVLLPVEAFSGRDLPLSSGGLPPAAPTEDAVPVSKSRFTLHSRVDGVPWATASGLDALLPGLLLLLLAATRNLLTTGSPLRVVPTGGSVRLLPDRPPHGQVAQRPGSRPRPKKGPPPSRRGRGRRRKR